MTELQEIQDFRVAYHNAIIEQLRTHKAKIICMRACESWYRNELQRLKKKKRNPSES